MCDAGPLSSIAWANFLASGWFVQLAHSCYLSKSAKGVDNHLFMPFLTHWGQVTLKCISNLCQFVPTVTFFPVTFFPTCPLLLSFLSLYSYCYPNELLLSFLLLFFLLAHCYFLSCYFIHTATQMNCYFLSCYFFSYLPTVTFFPVTLFIQLPQRTVTFFHVTFFPTCPLLLSFLLLFFLLVNCYFLSCYFFSCYFFSYLKLLLSFLLPFFLLLSFCAPTRHGCEYPVQRTHEAMITSLLRQNDVETSFCRNNYVINASLVHWARTVTPEIATLCVATHPSTGSLGWNTSVSVSWLALLCSRNPPDGSQGRPWWRHSRSTPPHA